MTPELKYLAMITVFTALLWIPYILNVIARNPLRDAVGYPATPLSMAPWAERLKKAHYNAAENLVAFSTIVLIAHVLDVRNEATNGAAAAYFWARLVHPVAYTLAIPWIRTLAFLVAWGGVICIAWHVFALA